MWVIFLYLFVEIPQMSFHLFLIFRRVNPMEPGTLGLWQQTFIEHWSMEEYSCTPALQRHPRERYGLLFFICSYTLANKASASHLFRLADESDSHLEGHQGIIQFFLHPRCPPFSKTFLCFKLENDSNKPVFTSLSYHINKNSFMGNLYKLIVQTKNKHAARHVPFFTYLFCLQLMHMWVE